MTHASTVGDPFIKLWTSFWFSKRKLHLHSERRNDWGRSSQNVCYWLISEYLIQCLWFVVLQYLSKFDLYRTFMANIMWQLRHGKVSVKQNKTQNETKLATTKNDSLLSLKCWNCTSDWHVWAWKPTFEVREKNRCDTGKATPSIKDWMCLCHKRNSRSTPISMVRFAEIRSEVILEAIFVVAP